MTSDAAIPVRRIRRSGVFAWSSVALLAGIADRCIAIRRRGIAAVVIVVVGIIRPGGTVGTGADCTCLR
jgi:hypothetical protein